VDACVAMLRETGWLNFRMRAMLVSVAAYPLWLHWQPVGHWLARQFLDYEPGIHWPQMQMQSGTTGINTTRVYNPIKQAMDHDPQGRFVRQWLPALRRVPDSWLFEPWRMGADLQARLGLRVGEDIAVRVRTRGGLWPALFDPTQAVHVLVNLAVNARDAMPDGGTLTIRTRNLEAPDAVAGPEGEPNPSHVLLQVVDTGVGMDEETLARPWAVRAPAWMRRRASGNSRACSSGFMGGRPGGPGGPILQDGVGPRAREGKRGNGDAQGWRGLAAQDAPGLPPPPTLKSKKTGMKGMKGICHFHDAAAGGRPKTPLDLLAQGFSSLSSPSSLFFRLLAPG